ncbi:MAG: ABC transporter ATP-binding protein [Ruminococcus sp.]|nr:ABC transporter ATP-binding protein [Ruminococcus sp.]
MNNNTLLKVSHLNKSMGGRQILHDISFEAYAGEVFGFLGPNGAGKTTTIKIAVGLLSLDDGSIMINGIDVKKNFEKALANVGGIVENPEMYKYLTGMENLKQYARMRKGVTQQRINEVVELVKLSNRINDKVSKYSLGMRQRLGVAQALLHRPKVLILDEPTNGLDPAGIKELRDILKETAHKENICVIVSSHLMSEMELMCDRVGIIANGRMIGVHSLEDMISASNSKFSEFMIRVDDNAAALAVIDVAEDKKKLVDGVIEVSLPTENADEEISRINFMLINNGIKLYTVSQKENKKLEDVFIELTEDQKGGGQIG